MSKALSFFKVEGTGNDFIVVDAIPQKLATLSVDFIKKVCDRHFGVGADGLVILRPGKLSVSNVQWEFYNNDGSRAEMCGNAARAIGAYYCDTYKTQKLTLETEAGLVAIEKRGKGQLAVQMTWPQQKAVLDDGMLINSGVPHLIVERERLDENIDRPFCQALRQKLLQQNISTNITLVQQPISDQIQIVSFERGVENFTLSCGTGAMAAAFYAYLKLQKNKIDCTLPGGQLEVGFDPESKQVVLVGPARVVYRGELEV